VKIYADIGTREDPFETIADITAIGANNLAEVDLTRIWDQLGGPPTSLSFHYALTGLGGAGTFTATGRWIPASGVTTVGRAYYYPTNASAGGPNHDATTWTNSGSTAILLRDTSNNNLETAFLFGLPSTSAAGFGQLLPIFHRGFYIDPGSITYTAGALSWWMRAYRY
jgi:hypothetical protein